MRINGVNEKYCTGNASPDEKFKAWASTVPYTVRNPLYHWTHLELKRYFGITDLLDEKSAEQIYESASMMLQTEEFRVHGMLQKMNVKVVCTTDDPIDALQYHQQFAKMEAGFKMFPTFRPDKSYATHDVAFYNRYVDSLGNAAHGAINTLDDLFNALSARMDFFDSLGCRAADHGLEHLYFDEQARKLAPDLFKKIRSGSELTWIEQNQLRCAILLQLSKWYCQKGWVQQFHLGAMRNNNSRMMKAIGPDTGFDSIGDFSQARHMSSFFNELDKTNELTKTIIYNLNPSDNEVFAAMLGNFSDGSVPGKMQWGSGWWFLDQKDGMEKQMNTLSNMGLLSQFVGMVTDSRSFLSFPRHEYFRRILCNLMGNDVERGELPNDINHLGKIVQDICFNNTMKYFGF
jgi:glucuronate isomerase